MALARIGVGFKPRFIAMGMVMAALLLSVASAHAATPDESRAKIREQSAEVLALLYKSQPSAEGVVTGAKGYATFSKWGLKLGVVGGGAGKGLLVANGSGDETFMNFVEGSAGIGLGIKKFALVFVFETDEALANFTNKGWEAGSQGTVAVKGKKGGRSLDGAVSVSPGVWVYQITERGLSADLVIKGTKYFPDKKLN